MPERHHVTAKTPINLSIAGISLIPGFIDKVLFLPSNSGPLE